MEKLHSGAKWQFRISGYLGALVPGIFIMIAFSSILPLIFFMGNPEGGINEIGVGFFFLMFFFLVAFVVIASEIYAQMSYNRWFYEFGSDALKLERGIIWKKYSNVPYDRVQNVDVHRGILARLLGFSSVNIQTAGYSAVQGGYGGVGGEGYIPAVSTHAAEKIREFLMKKISKKHNSSSGM